VREWRGRSALGAQIDARPADLVKTDAPAAAARPGDRGEAAEAALAAAKAKRTKLAA
jgi:hypothetical protein